MTTTALEQIEEEQTEKQFLSFINRGGIPYERTLLEKYFDRVASILSGNNPPPYELEIQTSSKCNVSCVHCWARDLIRLEDRLTEKETIDRILEQVLGFRNNGFEIETIKFCGSTGEPLVNPLTLYAIEILHGKKYLRLFTNGIKLAENRANEAYLRAISKINRINVSLDAGTTETLHKTKKGSAHVTLENILQAVFILKQLSDIGIDISYVITNHNYQEIVEATKKAKHSKANSIKFRIDLTDRRVSQLHGKEITTALEEAKSYEDANFKVIQAHSEEEVREQNPGHFSSREKGYKCFTSRLWACIGSNGCLYPCGHDVSADTRSYGNLLTENFPDIYESSTRREVLGMLPGERCSICSPFSLRTNEFMTFLSQLPLEEVKRLNIRHVKK